MTEGVRTDEIERVRGGLRGLFDWLDKVSRPTDA